MTGEDPRAPDPGPERIVITDKRRVHLDLDTVVAKPAPEPDPELEPELEPEPEQSEELPGAREAELLADLQRVSAEYANYRKRVDRDRMAVIEAATGALLEQLLPLLDDIDRARHHGDLTGGFKGVGEALETVVTKLGLERFGEVGEPFDPAVHEALMQAPDDPESAVATCAQVLQQGYRLSTGKVLRPARVAVAEGALTVTVEPPGADVPAPTES